MKNNQIALLVIGMLIGGAMGGVVSSYFAYNVAHADSSAGVLKARQVQLLDERGNPRAVLGFDNDKNPVLLFFDKNGNNGSYLGQTSHGGSLQFMDSAGKARLHISLDDEEKPGVYLLEGTKKIRASFYITSDNNPLMALTDGNGKPCLAAGLERDSEPVLFLKNKASDSQTALLSHPRLGPGLFLMDSRDKANKAYTTKGVVDADFAVGKDLGVMMMR